MGTAFDGTWTDEEGKEITITSQADLLTVKYPVRGPFSGFTVNVGSPVIYIDFTDHDAFTGVLSVANKTEPLSAKHILWANQTIWTRKGSS
ncbi:MAG TPA: hypothetical protein VFT45_16720 [Longimicrobium sp.]|nr:hypothetical protein [Longimicrobium sp.]